MMRMIKDHGLPGWVSTSFGVFSQRISTGCRHEATVLALKIPVNERFRHERVI